MKHSKKVLPITLLVVLGGGIAATSVYAQDASKFLKTFFTSVEVTHKAETESTFHLFEKMADKKTSEATTANLTKDEVIQKLKDNTTRMTINIPQEIQDKVVLDNDQEKSFIIKETLPAGEYEIPYEVCIPLPYPGLNTFEISSEFIS